MKGDGPDEAGWQHVGGDDDSVATIKVTNIHRTRIGLSVTVPPSTKEPDKKLCLQLQKWFDKMRETDGTFSIIPWKVDDKDVATIKTKDKIPTLMSKMRVYFARAQAKSAGGKVNMDCFVQHSVPITDLRSDAEWFLRENGMGVFHKELQVESTEQKGWLLYSTMTLDLPLLAAEIYREIGVKVALRWKYINTDKYEADFAERKKWMATHIEVDVKDSKKASRGLARLYGSTSKRFPLGIRMRLVSEYREVKGNVTMMGKHTRLRIRQASFASLMVGHPSDDIVQLDYEVNGTTLRKMVMSIRSTNPSTPGPLFHAIGKDWKGRIFLNFLQNKKNEATMIADGLIPYLEYHYDSRIYEFFDPEAVTEKSEWKWDPTTKTIINPLSRELEGLDAIDEDYNFSENTSFSISPAKETAQSAKEGEAHVPAATLAANRLNMVLAGEDADSVSTLGNPLSPSIPRSPPASTLLPVEGVSSAKSVQSEVTLDTRVSVIEQKLDSMEASLKSTMSATLDSFLAKMQASVSQPPGGASAGGKNG